MPNDHPFGDPHLVFNGAAGRPHHHAVDIRVIHKGNSFSTLVSTADDDTLRQLRRLIFLCLCSPCGGRKRHLPVSPSDFGFGGEPSGTMLAVTHCFAFDAIEVI